LDQGQDLRGISIDNRQIWREFALLQGGKPNLLIGPKGPAGIGGFHGLGEFRVILIGTGDRTLQKDIRRHVAQKNMSQGAAMIFLFKT